MFVLYVQKGKTSFNIKIYGKESPEYPHQSFCSTKLIQIIKISKYGAVQGDKS